MNTSFKTGDKIELTEDYHSFGKKGDQGTVTLDSSNYSYNENDMVGIDIGNFKGLGTYTRRLKLVVPEYKEGDRVQVTIPTGDTDSYGGAYFQTGTGTVDMVHSNGKRMLVRGTAVKDGSGPWWADKKFVTPLVEELPFEVGARVRSKDGYYGGDSEGIVTDLVPHIGGDITIAWDKGRALAGATCGATRSKLTVIASPVVERPAVKVGDTVEATRYLWSRVLKGTRLVVASLHDSGALRASVEGSGDSFEWHIASDAYKLVHATPAKKAIPATDTKPQIGDTIVAFWEHDGVETRKKGVIASFDCDGTAVTAEGEYITYDPEQEEAAEDSVFIVERAPKPEPVKELPEQFLLDAPVGSKATHDRDDLQYIKTGRDEWMLVFGDKLDAPRSSAALAGGEERAKRLTLHAL